jgi:hypothetical protein
MNTLMCAVATGLFSLDKLNAKLALARSENLLSRSLAASLAWVSMHASSGLTLLTSAYSIVVGAIFLLGSSSILPSLTG